LSVDPIDPIQHAATSSRCRCLSVCTLPAPGRAGPAADSFGLHGAATDGATQLLGENAAVDFPRPGEHAIGTRGDFCAVAGKLHVVGGAPPRGAADGRWVRIARQHTRDGFAPNDLVSLAAGHAVTISAARAFAIA